MTINHMSTYRKQNRIFTLKESTWKSINILCLPMFAVLIFGNQAATAGQSAKFVSPIPLAAYAMSEPTPTPIIKTKIVYATSPVEVKQAVKAQVNPSEWNAFEKVISSESGFNPKAINKESGACGMFQALPCEKMNCSLTDVTCQVKWGLNYIKQRYGNANNALSFHLEKGWY